MRIIQYIARAGICSRRAAKELLLTKKITINDKIVTIPATIVQDGDIVQYNNNLVTIKDTEIWLFHKAIGCLTSKKDPQNRPLIYDYLDDYLQNFSPIGRLDYNSEGLLLLTNDGNYKRKLELPKNQLDRVYKVRIFGKFNPAHKKLLESGVEVSGIFYHAKKVIITKISNNSWLEITLNEGKNREIRIMLEYLGYQVNRLIRISYGKYKLSDLKVGEYKKGIIY
jgi:23S rRNA pseudouridine2605 synthase